MSTNMRAKKKLILMEFAGSIITAGLIILNVFMQFWMIGYGIIIGIDGMAYVMFASFVLFNILMISLGSFVMAAGLKWPEVSTLMIFFYVSFSPILAYVILILFVAPNLEYRIGITAVVLICHILIRQTVSFCTKRGKAYRQKLLDEIAAEEAVVPPQDS